MRILYYGQPTGNSGSRLRGMKLLGHEVEHVYDPAPQTRLGRLFESVEWRLRNGPLAWSMNQDFLRKARAFQPEIVWTEMGKLVYASTLRTIKNETGCTLVNTYTDNFMNPEKRSGHYNRSIPLFDHMFAARMSNFHELRRFGAKRIYMFLKGYNPELHFPEVLSPFEQRRYGADVVFAGHCEPTRIETFKRLAETVPNMKVWGNGWQRYDIPEPLRGCVQFRGAEGHEYRKALRGAKIALQFCSRWNKDLHSSRSFEVPACGVFMLAERTEEHLSLFEEGKEAEYYSSVDEMIDKIRFYLAHDAFRQRIAEGGYRRSITSGYSNYHRVARMLQTVTGVPQILPAEPVLASA